MANTSKRKSRVANKAGARKTPTKKVRMPKAMRKTAFSASRLADRPTIVVTLDTPDGQAEARRVGPGEWQIGYPTGDDTFFGTKPEVIARMRRRIAAEYPAGDPDE